MTAFNHDTHLSEEDEQLFDHHARSWRKKSERAAEDLTRDLKRLGYLDSPDHAFVDAFAKATTTVAFVASGDGDLTVPAGTRLVALDPTRSQELADVSAPARVVFVTDEELLVTSGQTASVGVTAEHPGTPHNIEAGWLTATEDDLTNLESLTNAAAATGGVNHQLTRAAVYRAMELIMFDLMREPEDVFDTRRRLYGKMYKDELDRLGASGLEVDTDGDGVASEEEVDTYQHTYIRLNRR